MKKCLFILLVFFLSTSCNKTTKSSRELYYHEQLPFVFKKIRSNVLQFKIPSFVKNEVYYCTEIKTDIFKGFDEYDAKDFVVSTDSTIRTNELIHLKRLNISDKLLDDFEHTYWKNVSSTNHFSYFSLGLNGEIIFHTNEKLEAPQSTSVTFLPKYDRTFDFVFYENDLRIRLYILNESKSDLLKIMINISGNQDDYFKIYEFEPF